MINLIRRSAFSVACMGALSLGVPHGALAGLFSHGSHGSSGGSHGSHGSSGGSHGSHGSSGGSHGSHGGLFKHFKKSSHGSHGSSGGSHGSHGGSHGSHGGSHGSHGGSHGSYGGYYASVPAAAPQGVALVQGQTGALNISVPADAKLYLQDQLMTLTGAERRFVTPAIAEGEQFVTTVRVEFERDGRVVTETVEARVNPGEEVNVAVNFDGAVILAGR